VHDSRLAANACSRLQIKTEEGEAGKIPPGLGFVDLLNRSKRMCIMGPGKREGGPPLAILYIFFIRCFSCIECPTL
jgi:hypothetical protein